VPPQGSADFGSEHTSLQIRRPVRMIAEAVVEAPDPVDGNRQPIRLKLKQALPLQVWVGSYHPDRGAAPAVFDHRVGLMTGLLR
jgi:hypothetical protein